MKTKIKIIIVLLFCISLGCEKGTELKDRNYPFITAEINSVNQNGVELTGKFLTVGSSDIKEFGFIWGSDESNLKYKIVIKEFTNEFKYSLNSDIVKDEKYFVKAYAINDDYTVYGNVVSFISKGFNLGNPEIQSFYPTKVTDSHQVNIIGNNFSFLKEKVKVTIDDFNCEILSCNNDSIIFKVPPLSAGDKNIKVSIYDKNM